MRNSINNLSFLFSLTYDLTLRGTIKKKLTFDCKPLTTSKHGYKS